MALFYPSDIYGGLGSSWDYGPLGVELANNIKRSWWNWAVYERDDIEGLDSSIILNRAVWKYSGHETTFSDPLVDCRECKSRLRQDKLDQDADGKFVCSNCGSTNLTDPRPFNLMFRTTIGAVSSDDDPTALAYLRPETAQGISSPQERLIPRGESRLASPRSARFRNEERRRQLHLPHPHSSRWRSNISAGRRTPRGSIRNGSIATTSGSRASEFRATT